MSPMHEVTAILNIVSYFNNFICRALLYKKKKKNFHQKTYISSIFSLYLIRDNI